MNDNSEQQEQPNPFVELLEAGRDLGPNGQGADHHLLLGLSYLAEAERQMADRIKNRRAGNTPIALDLAQAHFEAARTIKQVWW